MRFDVRTPAAYVRAQPVAARRLLTSLRRLVLKTAPDVEERVEYGHLVYRMGEPLFALARQKRSVTLYIADHEIVARHRESFGRGVSFGKSCIRFPTAEHVPWEVVTRMLRESVRRRKGGAISS